MSWKRLTKKSANLSFVAALAAVLVGACNLTVAAQAPTNSVVSPGGLPAKASTSQPSAPKFRAVDADNHTILLNRPGIITMIVGTSEDSQNGARAAGRAMYPFQGRPDFQLIVIVDLRDSLATWLPSVVIGRMRSSLDQEAIELRPYFLKNGNKSNPRSSCHVVPDFSGTICPQIGWKDTSDDLRGILFGADGRDIERWDKLEDMAKLQADVRDAIQALVIADQTKIAGAAKPQGTKLLQSPVPHPPLLPLPSSIPKE
jgi:hypothetical protein